MTKEKPNTKGKKGPGGKVIPAKPKSVHKPAVQKPGQKNHQQKAAQPPAVADTKPVQENHNPTQQGPTVPLQHVSTDQNKIDHSNNRLEFGEEIRKMLASAGTLEMTPEQKETLYAKVKDEEVWLKPDGLIYLSWIHYSKRLNDTFTGTGWTMIPEGMPKINNNLVIWGFHLVIKGIYCGFAIGEQQFFNNNRMTYGEATEGAKSNALMRLCKSLGIGLELWDQNFISRWLKTYAEKYPDPKDNTKLKWRKKGEQNIDTRTIRAGNPTFGDSKSETQNKPPVPPQQPVVSNPVSQNVPPNPIGQNNVPQPMESEGQKTKPGTKDIQSASIQKPVEQKVQPSSGTRTDSVLFGIILQWLGTNKTQSQVPESTRAFAAEHILKKIKQLYYNIILTKEVEFTKTEYEKAKIMWEKGEINEDEKEILREVANKHFKFLNEEKNKKNK